MKLCTIILFLISLTCCSIVQDNVSQMSKSFNKLLVIRKDITTRTTRTPIGNRRFLEKKYVKNDVKQIDINIPKSPDHNSEPQIEVAKESDKSFKVSNIFKTKKVEDKPELKYPKLNTVPQTDIDRKKIISQGENEIKQMQKDIDKVKKEVRDIEDQMVIDKEIKVDHPKNDSEDSNDSVINKDEVIEHNINQKYIQLKSDNNELNSEIDEKTITNIPNDKIIFENSPEVLQDIDETGIYIKQNKRNNTLRPVLLPSSRYDDIYE